MTQTQEQMVARLRKRHYSIGTVALKVGATYGAVKYYCTKHNLTQKDGVSSQATSNDDLRTARNGRDLWPVVPYHIRITDRGHGQSAPKALGT